MNAVELLESMIRQGFVVAADGDGIRVQPWSGLTVDLRKAILTHKPTLLALLRERPRQVRTPTERTEAATILAELRDLTSRIEFTFGNRLPRVLSVLLADARTIGERFADEQDIEAARGWDSRELLRDLIYNVQASAGRLCQEKAA